MTLDYLRTLYAYTDWANNLILSAGSRLSTKQRHANLESSFPSIHDTLVHMMSAEWIWLARWTGSSPKEMSGDFDEFNELHARWRRISQDRRAFIDELTTSDVRRTVSYRDTAGTPYEQPLWELMCHAANHATYHRGQVITMIRQLGEMPISTDMIAYFRSDAYERPVALQPT